ncbi:MAG: sulfite exporter TauE/SafE family protein [Candidatus Saganbacteria bacterium]|nr:sulfite exporter TauE/SafE family protein [Candidatus Saganbacteria bacterium]
MIYEAIIIIGTGLAAGFFSGLMGVGGGTITIPALVLLLGATQQLAQGTSLALIIPTAIIGAYAYHKRGYVHIDKALWIVLGAVLGAFFGAQLAALLPGFWLKKIFAAFAIFLSVKMFLGR